MLRQFLQSIAILRDPGSRSALVDLAELLVQGRVDEALSLVEAAAARFANTANTVFIAGGESTASFIGGALNVIIGFDQVNERAVAAMRANRLRLVQQFTAEQTRATRSALIDGITRGLNPRDQALNFRDSLGLTERQTQAVQNYRRLLEQNNGDALERALRDRRFDGTVRRAVRTGEPLSTTQIDRMVGRYNERSLAMRAETIARTEALRSAHEGTNEMFQQAFDEGTLNPNQVTQTWETSQDGRVRDPGHTIMQSQQRRVGEPFTSGLGNALRFPGDATAPAEDVVMCRCVVTTRI